MSDVTTKKFCDLQVGDRFNFAAGEDILEVASAPQPSDDGLWRCQFTDGTEKACSGDADVFVVN